MMLAAVETVTKADPVWESRRHNSDVAAKATARESVHAASPLKSSGRNVYNEPRRASMKDAPAFSAVGFTIARPPASGTVEASAWKTHGHPRPLQHTTQPANHPAESTSRVPTSACASVLSLELGAGQGPRGAWDRLDPSMIADGDVVVS